MNKNIIVIFGSDTIIEKAKAENINTINVLLSEMITKEYYMKAAVLSDETIIIKDINKLDNIMSKLVSINKIDAIVSFTDNSNGVYLAAKYSNKLLKENLTTSEQNVKLVSNKYLTRKYLDSINLRNTKFINSKSANEVIDFYKQICKSIILKPIYGQGSLEVKKVSDIKEITDYFNHNPGIEVIAEEFLEGKEVSVESIVIHGKIHILGITEKFIIGENSCGHNPFVELGHVFPANLDTNIKKSVYDYIFKFLENLNINNSISHSEVMITKDGPVLVESHLRPGGDGIPHLVENAIGHELHQLFFRSLFEDFSIDINYKTKSAIKFLIPPVGKISSYKNFDSFKNNNSIDTLDLTLSIGQDFTPVKDSHDRSCGYIISIDPTDPMLVIDKIFKNIDVEIQ